MIGGIENVKEALKEFLEELKNDSFFVQIVALLIHFAFLILLDILLLWMIDLRDLGFFDILPSALCIMIFYSFCRSLLKYPLEILLFDQERNMFLNLIYIGVYSLALLFPFMMISITQMFRLDPRLEFKLSLENEFTLYSLLIALFTTNGALFIAFISLISFIMICTMLDARALFIKLARQRIADLLSDKERVKPSKSFRINKYLEVKLIREETVLFVNGEEFLQCKSLMLSIPYENIKDYDEINSIDEALAKNIIENHHGYYPTKISPEEEFWGHCSNLQAWYENKYDPRLLHSNLAFPLLKALTDAGDPLAKTILKEEIVRQLEDDTLSLNNWIHLDNFLDYLSYFTDEEIKELHGVTLSIVREKLFGDFREFREEEEEDNE